MSRTEGNLVGEEVSVGDTVILTRRLERQYRVNTNQTFDIEAGDRFIVTRVFAESLMIRSLRTYSVPVSYHREEKNVSFQVNRASLMFEDENYVPPPPPRKLGTKPEDSEDIPFIHIAIDDPGIQWLWDDMGKFAEQQGYCSQYDALCAKLGIPGRPRDFTVRTTVKGIQLSTTVLARSQRDANQIVHDALAQPESIEVGSDEATAA